MKEHFEQLAAYNRWANARLYEAAFGLDDTEYRRNVGVFFKSMHGTLNHLLLTDRIWLKRLTADECAKRQTLQVVCRWAGRRVRFGRKPT
jgi:uncharacterized damage-inducible protein DinB